MSLRKKAQAPATVAAWSVSDLSALYTQNRSSLIAQARRILRSDADAAEVVQDAFLKFILAAPELDTADRAMAYLRTTVNNLCLNVIRATGSRPNLVAIDSDDTQERLSEIAAENHIPMDSTLAAAEDGIRDLVRSRGLGDVYKRQLRPQRLLLRGLFLIYLLFIPKIALPLLSLIHI